MAEKIEWLKKNVDRIGAIASILGLFWVFLINGIYWWLGPNPNVAIVVQNTLFMVLLSWFLYYYVRKSTFHRENFIKSKRTCDYVCDIIHKFSHLYRNCSTEIDTLYRDGKQYDFKNKHTYFLDETCNLIKDIFDSVTGQDCGIAIKTLINETTVVTAARDRESRERRKEGHKYIISENTAFDEIHRHKKTCFFHNNLKDYPNYHNTNSGWDDFYNCTIVVPIRCYEGATQNLVGYLGVDCKENISDSMGTKEIFNDNEHKDFLGIFADTLYVFLDEFLDCFSQNEFQN